MTTVDPRTSALRAIRAIAADISWAMTPHRAERTAPARRKSPMSLDYWIAKVRAERRITDEQTIRKAAKRATRRTA